MPFARLSLFCALLITGVLTAGARAGVLNNHPNAIPGFTGSTPFASGTLTGFVDYAVFQPGNFPFAGYIPTPGQATYAYQVFITGTAPLASFSVALTDAANNIGSFNDLPGDPPTSASITPLVSADWTFAGVLQGGNTRGLAFSSPKLPINLFGSVVDTGQSAFVIPLPSPGPVDVPEPAAAGIVLIGVVVAAARRRVR
jgi:hypothetical protein